MQINFFNDEIDFRSRYYNESTQRVPIKEITLYILLEEIA